MDRDETKRNEAFLTLILSVERIGRLEEMGEEVSW